MKTLQPPSRRNLLSETATFGLVGGLCLVLDLVLFNALTFGAHLLPELAKAITMLVTGMVAFLGHRRFTFRHRRGRGVQHEVPMFIVVTLLSLLVGLAPIWFTREVLGLGGPFWLNAANLVGVALGAVARFVLYRRVVWGQVQPEGVLSR